MTNTETKTGGLDRVLVLEVARVTEAEDGFEIGARFTSECQSEQP